MPGSLPSISPPARLYRVGRAPDPWAWPDWAYAGADGTFGNRWDDPAGSYRILYAASQRLAAFVEVLARFRPDPLVIQEMLEIHGEEEGSDLPAGHIDVSWLDRLRVGEATVCGRFADVGRSEWLARLRHDLAERVVSYGLSDLDAAAIRLSAPRRFTQEISRYVFELAERGRGFEGISYFSRLGDDFRLWAIFEPVLGTPAVAQDPLVGPISPDDPDLRRALEVHDLVLVGPRCPPPRARGADR